MPQLSAQSAAWTHLSSDRVLCQVEAAQHSARSIRLASVQLAGGRPQLLSDAAAHA